MKRTALLAAVEILFKDVGASTVMKNPQQKRRSLFVLIGVIGAMFFCLSTTVQASIVLYANITLDGGGSRALATIDTTTGQVTQIGTMGARILGITYLPELDLLLGMAPGDGAVNPSTLFQIDRQTGAATAIGSTGVSIMYGLQYDPITDRLYAVSQGRPEPVFPEPSLYTLDPSTGAATLVGSLELPSGVDATRDLALDAFNDVLYLGTEGDSDAGQDFNGLNTVHKSSGQSTFIGTYKEPGGLPTAFNSVRALAYDISMEMLLGVNGGNPDQLISIDPLTGMATDLLGLSIGSQNSSHVMSLAFAPSGGVSTSCDFTGNDICNVTDLDLMQSLGPIALGIPATGNEQFDLNDDDVIDLTDRDEWLSIAAAENGFGSPYKLGDANLDGVVDGSDFISWSTAKFTANLLWSKGNFNADAVVDGQDLLIWNANKFTSSDGVSAVPEPGTGMLMIAAMLLLGSAAKQR